MKYLIGFDTTSMKSVNEFCHSSGYVVLSTPKQVKDKIKLWELDKNTHYSNIKVYECKEVVGY